MTWSTRPSSGSVAGTRVLTQTLATRQGLRYETRSSPGIDNG